MFTILHTTRINAPAFVVLGAGAVMNPVAARNTLASAIEAATSAALAAGAVSLI